MDAARGPPPSLGATPAAKHDTLRDPIQEPDHSWHRAPLPAALAGSDTGGNLASGGFA
jgi:hypothetical protein